MEISKLLEKLQITGEYIYKNSLTDDEIQKLQSAGYTVEPIPLPECPCGNWRNDLCRCKWSDLMKFLEERKNSIGFKIKRGT